MTNNKSLCMDLMNADSEERVIQLLKDAGYWDLPSAWRYYGGYENNYNTIGNQQSRPDAALVEKLVNSIDARLLNECIIEGTDPKGPNAPKSMPEAVARFFRSSSKLSDGYIKTWSSSERLDAARGITLAATGFMPREGYPCFTVSDSGEGQTPLKIANTILSLNRSNKLNIRFVQGKFNMGGSGALKFCGRHNLQLVLTRRNPLILDREGREHDTDADWGFSIVRRKDPDDSRRNSMYEFLAPEQGAVLHFSADSMPIFPEDNKPYHRPSEWGTLIKLYEYEVQGYRSNILRKGGILQRLDLLMPNAALPIRLHECRKGYGGVEERSYATNLTGVEVRISDSSNLEPNFPSTGKININGQDIPVSIYAFVQSETDDGKTVERAETYRKDEGIIFVINGQTHGHFTEDFFRRNRAGGFGYLAESLLVIVDCSELDGRAREDLFMNSRDRLSGGELKKELERELEVLLSESSELRELKNRRRQEEIKNKTTGDKPFEDVLEVLFKRSPTLSKLFLEGQRISAPFKTEHVTAEPKPFKGKEYPTFFKFAGKTYGAELEKDCNLNRRCRIAFETDAANDYFRRDVDRGNFQLFMLDGQKRIEASSYVLNLQNGIATLSVRLPEKVKVDDILNLVAVTTDSTRPAPFENSFNITVKPEAALPTGTKGPRKKPPSKEKGEEREVPAGISLPDVIEVYRRDWAKRKFDQFSALQIVKAGIASDLDSSNTANGAETDNDGIPVYDFYVNMDNLYLQTELKLSKLDPPVLQARWRIALVMVGLAMIQDSLKFKDENPKQGVELDDELGEEQSSDKPASETVEQKVETLTRALAPILLPMIGELGTLALEEHLISVGIGEAT